MFGSGIKDKSIDNLPILIASSEGSIQLDFRVHFIGVEVARIEIVAQFTGPRALRFDVARKEVLVRRRCQRKRVELFRLDLGARQTDPLARKILEIRWPVELDLKQDYHNITHTAKCSVIIYSTLCYVRLGYWSSASKEREKKWDNLQDIRR